MNKDKRKQQMIDMRYNKAMTLQQIGDAFGVSRERVRQIIGNKYSRYDGTLDNPGWMGEHASYTDEELSGWLGVPLSAVQQRRRKIRRVRRELPVMSKRCPSCNEIKLRDEFYKDNRRHGGLYHICKECRSEYMMEYNSKPEVKKKRKKSQKAYMKTKDGKSAAARSARKYRKRYPKKDRARQIMRYAIRTGKLERKPCEVCGNPKVDGHHDDYSKPLKVRWLCRKHHLEHHNNLRKNEYQPRQESN